MKKEIERGNRRMILTLAYCQKFGQAEEPQNAERFDSFVESLRRRGLLKEKIEYNHKSAQRSRRR